MTLEGLKSQIQNQIDALFFIKSGFYLQKVSNDLQNRINELTTLKNNLTGAYNQVSAKNDSLSGTVVSNKNKIADLQNTINKQQAKINRLNVEIQQINTEINEKTRQINELNKSIGIKNTNIQSLTVQRDSAVVEREAALARKKKMIVERDKVAAKVEPLEKKLKTLTAEEKILESEWLTADSNLKKTNKNIEDLKIEINDTVAENKQNYLLVEAELINDREVLINQHQAEAKELNKDAEIIKINSGAQSSLEDFIKQTNENLTNVHQGLRESGAHYHLGPIDLELKMLPGMGGSSVSLPQLSDLKEVVNDHLSTIKVRFIPNQQAQATNTDPSDNNLSLMPDMTGQTVTYAQRKLNQLGLQVKLLQKMVDDEAKIGRILSQEPLAHQPYPNNNIVNLWLGKYVSTIKKDQA